MTREELLKKLAAGNLGNPERRQIDFMLRRLSVAGDETALASRGLTDETASLGDGTLSLAERRLQQLRLFRQRQKEDDDRLAADAAIGERDLAVSGKLNWVPIGPAGYDRGQSGTLTGRADSLTADMSGRVKGIAVAPGGQRVYVASANGGVWYSENSGRHWVSLMDGIALFPDVVKTKFQADSLACGAIALAAGNGNSEDKIYVGTGEGHTVGDAYMGVGPLFSNNGGVDWLTEVAEPTLIGKGFFAMVLDPTDSDRVVAATNNGIYVRERVGSTFEWRQKGFNDRVVWCVTGAIDAANQPRYYASVRDGVGQITSKDSKNNTIHFWTTRIYTSSDAITWTLLNVDFPINWGGRTSLAVYPRNANIVYALVAIAYDEVDPLAQNQANSDNGNLEGIYRLDYGGDKKWYKIAGKTQNDKNLISHFFSPDLSKGGQGGYDNCLAVAPDNPNSIYAGGSIKDAGGGWAGGIYRCNLEVRKTATATTIKADVDYIGEAVHGDIQTLTFVPNEPSKLWAGCDGGVFYTKRAKADGIIFEPRNAGLQTITHNFMGLSAKEEEYFFVCGQDSGTMRYLGDDVWLHSFPGDGGYCVVNWAKDNEVIVTYTNNTGRKSIIGGNRPDKGAGYSTSDWAVTLVGKEQVLFYAPLVGVPYIDGLKDHPEKAEILAFGTQRPWISTDFGDHWKPIPSLSTSVANYNKDRIALDIDPNTNTERVQTMAFASSKILLSGSTEGKIHCFVDESVPNKWAIKAQIKHYRLDNKGEGSHLLNNGITDFAVLSDVPLQFYVTLGGASLVTDAVWFCDATDLDNPVWTAKSGRKGADMTKALLDFQYNSIVINPTLKTQLFVGSDVGVWKSDNSGDDWETFSFGLPETPVVDLKIFSPNDLTGPNVPVLLRAATHGRGVFECTLSEPDGKTPDVKLYLRGNELDRGRYKINLDKKDPRKAPPSVKIAAIDSPDIKIDVPNATTGFYQFSEKETLSAGQLRLNLTDEATQIPIPVTGDATTRIYVQVNSRGIMPATNVSVLLLVARMTGDDFPDLPTDYDEDLKGQRLINTDTWKTVGFKNVHGVKAGAAQVARFDFSSNLFTDKTVIADNHKLVFVALLHHENDPFSSKLVKIGSAVDANNVILSDERKIMYKVATVKKTTTAPPSVSAPQHLPLSGFVTIPETATMPEAPIDAFLGMAYRLNDTVMHAILASRLAQPFSNRGVDTPTSGSLDARNFYLADTIVLDKEIELQAGTPLIWCARKKITLSQRIIAKGKGDISGLGDFGGSGGGGSATAGIDCSLPRRSSIKTTIGGNVGNNGQDADEKWSSRALMMLPFCRGGSQGGDNGGLGGGVVVLCAPTIEFIGNGTIDASGAIGGGDTGGGGGGIIILIAHEIIGHTAEKTNIEGGIKAGTGGNGGKGFLLISGK